MQVYRQLDWIDAWARVSRAALVYGGTVLVLWVLGWSIRGPAMAWVIAAPLFLIVGVQLWARRRICVAIDEGWLRYEGARTADDFEVELDHIRSVYLDPSSRGVALVLVLDHDERALEGLNPTCVERLRRDLVALGVRDIQDLSHPA